MPRYLITADPITTFQPRFDTTLRLMTELLARGMDVDYCDLLTTDTTLPTDQFLARLPVQRVEFSDANRQPFIGLGPLRSAQALAYDVLIHRKDPPVDTKYRAYTNYFATLAGQVLQINEPSELLGYSEHLLPSRFPEYSVPTYHCKDFSTFINSIRAQPVEAVVKPIAECSGIGICFFRPDTPENALETWWQSFGEAVVQPYQDVVTTLGDLRILVIHRHILGSVTRLPRPGSRLANLHQGASYRAQQPTLRQLEAVQAVADVLTSEGLYFLGFDFLGDLISEINFTSPSAMVQINEVMHKRAEIELVDEIERMRQNYRKVAKIS